VVDDAMLARQFVLRLAPLEQRGSHAHPGTDRARLGCDREHARHALDQIARLVTGHERSIQISVVVVVEEGGDYTTFAAQDCTVGTSFETCSVSGTVFQDVTVKFGLQGASTDTDFIVDNAQLLEDLPECDPGAPDDAGTTDAGPGVEDPDGGTTDLDAGVSENDAGSPPGDASVELVNLFINPDFSLDPLANGWGASYFEAANAAFSWYESSEAFIEILTPELIWRAQLFQSLPATIGQTYTVSFDVRAASGTKSVQLYIQEDGGGFVEYATTYCEVGTNFTTCTLSGTVTANTQVKFGVQGANEGTDYYVDNAVLTLDN
jgi:hypothetical protein